MTLLTSPTFGFLLKLLAGLGAAVFGILGVGAETRDDNGRLTRTGWVALIGIVIAGVLAVSTSVYEFVTGQEKERAELLRNESILASVQRNLYPLHGVMASFQMQTDYNSVEVTQYKKILHDQISQNRQCKGSVGFTCYGVGVEGTYVSYRIYSSSRLFPRPGSELREVLENLYVYVQLFKREPKKDATSTDSKPFKYLGRFFVDWREGLPKKVWLEYDLDKNSLAFGAENYPVKDEEVSTAGVYSLVDFVPGAVVATPEVSDDRLCERLHLDVDTCRTKVLDSLAQRVALQTLQLKFPYPKSVTMDAGGSFSVKCANGGPGYSLALQLPENIEAIDSLGIIADFIGEPAQKICSGVERSGGKP
jgi:hypothetical protein